MKNLNSLLNHWTVFGCATAITVVGANIENPYLTSIGLNLGISGGVATFVSQKLQRQQGENKTLTAIRSLTKQIETVETHTQQQQSYLFDQLNNIAANLEQSNNNLQTLQSQHQHTVQEQKKLSFAVGNTQRQLNNHSKKLKKQQHEINTQKTTQNKVTSSIQKLKNQQEATITNQTKHLSKIETQVDRLIATASQQSTKLVASQPTINHKVVVPITHRQPQTLCYIDNNNLFNCLKEMGIKPDYKTFIYFLTAKTGKTQIKLYDGAFPNQKYKYAHLKQLGYQINTFPIIKRKNNQFKTVGDDVQLAVDMVKDFKAGDSVVLVSGDGDLLPAVREIKQRNVHVTLIAKKDAVNHDLCKLADKFITLESIKYDIARHTLVSA